MTTYVCLQNSRFTHSDWLRGQNVNKCADWSRTKFPLVLPSVYLNNKREYKTSCISTVYFKFLEFSKMFPLYNCETPKECFKHKHVNVKHAMCPCFMHMSNCMFKHKLTERSVYKPFYACFYDVNRALPMLLRH